MFRQKFIVSKVILAFLDHLKPKIFFVCQPWYQNLWIYPWKCLPDKGFICEKLLSEATFAFFDAI